MRLAVTCHKKREKVKPGEKNYSAGPVVVFVCVCVCVCVCFTPILRLTSRSLCSLVLPG